MTPNAADRDQNEVATILKLLPEDKCKQIFAALVAAQDEGLSVEPSRKAVAEHFGIPVEQVKAVEGEGLKNEWPPL